MISINGNKYEEVINSVSFDKYECVKNGIISKGTAPFFKFNINNNIIIGLETVYDLSLIKKNNNNNDITEYITDICYEDNRGWISLIIEGKFNCYLNKIKDKKYKISFNYNSISDDISNIEINETIIIDI